MCGWALRALQQKMSVRISEAGACFLYESPLGFETVWFSQHAPICILRSWPKNTNPYNLFYKIQPMRSLRGASYITCGSYHLIQCHLFFWPRYSWVKYCSRMIYSNYYCLRVCKLCKNINLFFISSIKERTWAHRGCT